MKFRPIVMARSDPHHVRHASFAEAEKEAVRLARLQPGKEFCVYVPMAILSIPESPVQRTDIIGFKEGEDDDIPF